MIKSFLVAAGRCGANGVDMALSEKLKQAQTKDN
jgi:hypothetical protein